MANKRRPPRKKHSSNQKGPGGNRENTDSNRGGNEQREGNRKYSHHQQQGKNFQRNQEFHRKSRELAMEKDSAPKIRAPRESGKLVVRVILTASILLLGIFSYFICENYHTKTPVYGKRGWDDTFHRSATWAEAREICEEKGNAFPERISLKLSVKEWSKSYEALEFFGLPVKTEKLVITFRLISKTVRK